MSSAIFIKRTSRLLLYYFNSKKVFQKNEDRFISLVLKAKQQNAIQLPEVCQNKFVMSFFMISLFS